MHHHVRDVVRAEQAVARRDERDRAAGGGAAARGGAGVGDVAVCAVARAQLARRERVLCHPDRRGVRAVDGRAPAAVRDVAVRGLSARGAGHGRTNTCEWSFDAPWYGSLADDGTQDKTSCGGAPLLDDARCMGVGCMHERDERQAFLV